MHLSHTPFRHRLLVPHPQAVFAFVRRLAHGPSHGFGASALHHPHIARHTRVPSFFGPRRPFAARVRALYVRIHTFYLKFLQGHT
ncbi:MAG: hypothetical protein RR473_00265 [Comamonas sp.]|uniref:hypothetical protein n=1 Tax=Comamonas sp. lk TaxID=2201272 RepID=UPI000EB26B87|nr:hypothetical protein [Comamonas sp. lk]